MLPRARAGRISRSTSCARDAMNSSVSARGSMSEVRSSRMRRTSPPNGVPPGSRRLMCGMPICPKDDARRRSCVVLPDPSPPSNTMTLPLAARLVTKLPEGDDGTLRALLDPVYDPVVHLRHDLVEILLRGDEPLIDGLSLHLSEQRIELAFHLLGGFLTALDHRLRS